MADRSTGEKVKNMQERKATDNTNEQESDSNRKKEEFIPKKVMKV
jgi:hypothetical protein